ncbi:hypothetical protein TRVL_09538 [Trypanosoma vivax]|nr:hypothetical protein TRVL_09538 [Trypanosoma vivax]
MLLCGLFGFSSGTMMPCRYLAGTWPARKPQLNSCSMRLLDALPSRLSSSRCTSSSPGAVPEDNSRSATSSSASTVDGNALCLSLRTFLSAACGAFGHLAMCILANARARWCLVSGRPSTTSTGDISDRGAYIDFTKFQLAEAVADSFDTFSLLSPQISTSRFCSFFHS